MDILFLLVPLSVVLAMAVVGVLAWAVWSGQFEDLEKEGQRIFQDAGQVNGPDLVASVPDRDLSSKKTTCPIDKLDPYQSGQAVPAAH